MKRKAGPSYRCRECRAEVRWSERYCVHCLGLPERHCFSCNRMSHTVGAECHECGKAFGRLQFGFDRLSDTPAWGRSSENERTSGWSDRANTAYDLFADGQHEGQRGDVYTISPKGKAPGSAWPTLARLAGVQNAAYTRWLKGAMDEVNWGTCFACGEAFKPGDAQMRWSHADGLRARVIAREPGKYTYDDAQKAHKDCELTADEQAALDAASYAVRAPYEYERAQRLASEQAA